MNKYRLSQAGIDANEGIRRFNNNKEMFEKFLYTFPENDLYEKMIKTIEAKDVKAAFQAAHALKGVTGNLSLVQLHADLIPLVEELRKDSLENADELLIPVKESYEKVMDALEIEISKLQNK